MRQLKIALLTLLLVVVTIIPSAAHSGRTDGSGGHTDRSTGDYHYHHGYPAHDHYDMDGDGDNDCPYSYRASNYSPKETKNSQSSSGSPSSKAKTEDYMRGYNAGFRAATDSVNSLRRSLKDAKLSIEKQIAQMEELSKIAADQYKQNEELQAQMLETSEYERKKLIWCVIISIALTMFGSIFVATKISKRKTDKIKTEMGEIRKEGERRLEMAEDQAAEKARDTHRQYTQKVAELTTEIGRLEQIITVFKAAIRAAVSPKSIEEMSESSEPIKLQMSETEKFLLMYDPLDEYNVYPPENVQIDEYGIPYTGDRSHKRPFGNLTIYIASEGKVCHRTRGCSGAYLPRCIYEPGLPDRPCVKCFKEEFPPFPRYPLWFRNLQKLRKDKKIKVPTSADISRGWK